MTLDKNTFLASSLIFSKLLYVSARRSSVLINPMLFPSASSMFTPISARASVTPGLVKLFNRFPNPLPAFP